MDAARFGRNSVLGAIAGLFITGSNFITSIVVARTLGVEGAGDIAYAVWLVTFLLPIFDLGIPSTIGRFVPALVGAGDGLHVHALAVWLFRLLLLALCLAAGAVLLVFAIAGVSDWTWSRLPASEALRDLHFVVPESRWLIIASWLVVQGLASFSFTFLRGIQKFDWAAIIAVAGFVVQVSAVLVGSLVFGQNGAIAGYALGQIPAAAGCLQLFKGSAAIPPEYRLRIIRYARYAWAGNIAAAFVWSRLEIFFLGHFWNNELVGLFAAALSMSNLAVQGPMLLTSGLLTLFSEQMGRNDIPGLQRAFSAGTRVMAFLLVPSCLGAAAIMPTLLPLLYGSAFASAAPETVILLASAALTAPFVVSTNLVYAAERSDFIFFSGLIGAVLSVLAGLILVPALGPVGAALSRAFVQISLVTFGCCFVTMKLGFKIPLEDLIRIVVASTLSAEAAYVVVSLWSSVGGLLVAITTGVLVYGFAIWILRPLPPDDVGRLVGIAQSCLRWIIPKSLQMG